MKYDEVFTMCLEMVNDYFSENIDTLYQRIIAGVKEEDDLSIAAWKMAVDSTRYSCETAVLISASLLIRLGVIEVSDKDMPLLLPNLDKPLS